MKKMIYFKIEPTLNVFNTIKRQYDGKLYCEANIKTFYSKSFFDEKNPLLEFDINLPIKNVEDIKEYKNICNPHHFHTFLRMRYKKKYISMYKRTCIYLKILKRKKLTLEKFPEYLNVDSDTDFYGNYHINGNDSIKLTYGKNTNKKKNYTKFKISSTDIPYHIQQKLLDKWGIYDTFYNITYENNKKLLEAINLLTEEEKFLIYSGKKYLLEDYANYFIRLSGNDDYSVIRYFFNKKDMLIYLTYLKEVSKELKISSEYDINNKFTYF